jgi:hypothetical protein
VEVQKEPKPLQGLKENSTLNALERFCIIAIPDSCKTATTYREMLYVAMCARRQGVTLGTEVASSSAAVPKPMAESLLQPWRCAGPYRLWDHVGL